MLIWWLSFLFLDDGCWGNPFLFTFYDNYDQEKWPNYGMYTKASRWIPWLGTFLLVNILLYNPNFGIFWLSLYTLWSESWFNYNCEEIITCDTNFISLVFFLFSIFAVFFLDYFSITIWDFLIFKSKLVFS